MAKHFSAKGVPFDVVLYQSYERQVEALLAGQVDIAWNGPLAHVRTQRVCYQRPPACLMRLAFTARLRPLVPAAEL